jgi:zinc/manganese transport system substrate-binding protein
MHTSLRRLAAVALSAGLALSLVPALASPGTAAERAGCPAEPLRVVVSVNQWGDITRNLAGACAKVVQILTDPNIDPHDYVPSAKAKERFAGADIVIVNGVGYDDWAQQAAEQYAPKATLVILGEGVGVQEGANPHLWYSPGYVSLAVNIITAALREASPKARNYFQERYSAYTSGPFAGYLEAVGSMPVAVPPLRYAATETIFNYMAASTMLEDRTPSSWEVNSLQEKNQTKASSREFKQLLRGKKVDVLIFNTQTSDPIAKKVVTIARRNGIPVVKVTETVPPKYSSFVSWQEAMIANLDQALRRA